MNVSHFLLSGLLITSTFVAFADKHGIYYSELKAFKKAPATKEMFDEDALFELSAIQRDITTYKNLTWFQRWVRKSFLECDVIIVTSETLPTLYAYVDGICKKANIITPTIFVTRQNGFFNAAAQKLLMSSGAIIIGQKLMHDISDEALEAVLAHEIGHIKYNHGNKTLALVVGSLVLFPILFKQFKLDKEFNAIMAMLKLIDENKLVSPQDAWNIFAKVNTFRTKVVLLLAGVLTLPSLFINKRFEKEADEFACKDNDKSKGLIEYFELTLQKEELREEEFVAIYNLLQENKVDLSLWSNMTLGLRYYMAKVGHFYNKAHKYIYYNTFLGAHPSPKARIEAAKKYLQQEA